MIPKNNGENRLVLTLVPVAKGPWNSRFNVVSIGALCPEGRWMSKMVAQTIRGR